MYSSASKANFEGIRGSSDVITYPRNLEELGKGLKYLQKYIFLWSFVDRNYEGAKFFPLHSLTFEFFRIQMHT